MADTNDSIEKIATHSGPFHCDEALAAAVLLEIFPGAEIIRTRDDEKIAEADVAIDVGGEYMPEPGMNRFDHHQVDDSSELARENGVPYAASGLVWRHFGSRVVEKLASDDLSDQQIGELIEKVDEQFIQGVDALDTGFDQPEGEVRHTTFANVISALVPSWHEETDMDEAFRQAVEVAQDHFERKLSRIEGEVLAREEVEQAERVDIGEGYEAMVLSRFCPWKAPLHEQGAGQTVFAVYPQAGSDDTWMLMQVPEEPEAFAPLHFGLPEELKGMRGEELQEASDVSDAVFIHPGGFCGGAASKEGALKLAKLAVEAQRTSLEEARNSEPKGEFLPPEQRDE